MALFSLSVLVAIFVNISTAGSGDSDMKLFLGRARINMYNKCCLVAYDCLLLLRYRFDPTKLKEVLIKLCIKEMLKIAMFIILMKLPLVFRLL